jgi:hypothetical protein
MVVERTEIEQRWREPTICGLGVELEHLLLLLWARCRAAFRALLSRCALDQDREVVLCLCVAGGSGELEVTPSFHHVFLHAAPTAVGRAQPAARRNVACLGRAAVESDPTLDILRHARAGRVAYPERVGCVGIATGSRNLQLLRLELVRGWWAQALTHSAADEVARAQPARGRQAEREQPTRRGEGARPNLLCRCRRRG